MSTREITYTWRVREIMARRGVHTAKDLADWRPPAKTTRRRKKKASS